MRHEDVVQQLPWYLNGTLEEDRRETIDRHLEHCSECRRELDELKLLARAEVELASRAPHLPDDLLDGVLGRIGREADEESPRREPAGLGPGGAEQGPGRAAAGLLDWARSLWQPIPDFGRMVLVAQALLLVVLAAVLLQQLTRAPLSTAGGPDDGSSGAPRLSVRFQESASIGEIEQLLRDIDASVVDGPSALGIFEVELGAGAAWTDDTAERVRAALERLRADDRVEVAESVP